MAMPRLAGSRSVTSRPAMQDVAGGDVLQPGDHPQQGRLAAARRADEDDELAAFDLEVEVVDDVHRAEALADVAQFDRAFSVVACSACSSPLP